MEVKTQDLFNTVRNMLSLFRVLFRTMHPLSCVKFYKPIQRNLVLLIDILNSLKQKLERRSCFGVFKLSMAIGYIIHLFYTSYDPLWQKYLSTVQAYYDFKYTVTFRIKLKKLRSEKWGNWTILMTMHKQTAHWQKFYFIE